MTYQIDGGAFEIVTLLSLVQGKGFGVRLVRAVEDAARQIKPSFPLIGEDDIPIRDEIRFEKTL